MRTASGAQITTHGQRERNSGRGKFVQKAMQKIKTPKEKSCPIHSSTCNTLGRSLQVAMLTTMGQGWNWFVTDARNAAPSSAIPSRGRWTTMRIAISSIKRCAGNEPSSAFNAGGHSETGYRGREI